MIPEARWVTMGSGEKSKTLEEAGRLCQALIDGGATRDSVIVLLGGGVVGDVGGFAASILFRGLRYVQMPTTLLAMVDSSIGGKTGVNLGAKNLVGVFHAPEAILADISLLSTLPHVELGAALFEAFKTALLDSEEFFEWVERGRDWRDQRALTALVARSAAYKIRIVERDFRERGPRRILNLGHTLGHAFEARCGLRHGHAIGWGMAGAILLSVRHGLLAHSTATRVLRALVQLAPLPPLPRRRGIASAIAVDKKRGTAGIRFVALRGIGRPAVVTLGGTDQIEAIADELMGRDSPPTEICR